MLYLDGNATSALNQLKRARRLQVYQGLRIRV
jgi:hypothetical protein